MSQEECYQQLNIDLAREFDLFAVENDAWMEANVPNGAIVVLQTNDPGFNAWARAVAERTGILSNRPGRLFSFTCASFARNCRESSAPTQNSWLRKPGNAWPPSPSTAKTSKSATRSG